MDNKEKEIREEERLEREEKRAHEKDPREDLIADSLKVNGKDRKRHSTKRINNLWLWLGVIVLIIILVYFLFTCVIAGDVSGGYNGN